MEETKTSQHEIAVLQKLADIDKGLAINTNETANMKTLMEKIDLTVQKLDDKVGVQNGRVRTIEDWSNAAKSLIESNSKAINTLNTSISGLNKSKIILWTSVIVGGALISTIITLGGIILKNEIKDATINNDSQLDLRVDAYIKNNYHELK